MGYIYKKYDTLVTPSPLVKETNLVRLVSHFPLTQVFQMPVSPPLDWKETLTLLDVMELIYKPD